jgi:hypothetical protein
MSDETIKAHDPRAHAAERAVNAILRDLSGRGGIGSEWDAVDPETQREVRATWIAAVLRHLGPAAAPAEVDPAPPERDLRTLQAGLYFGQSYSAAYRADPRPHRLLDHAIKHVCKATLKAVTVVEELDHTGGPLTPEQRAELVKGLADVVICAAQAAKHTPWGGIDLDAEVWARAVAKDAWRDPTAAAATEPAATVNASEIDFDAELTASGGVVPAHRRARELAQLRAVAIAAESYLESDGGLGYEDARAALCGALAAWTPPPDGAGGERG